MISNLPNSVNLPRKSVPYFIGNSEISTRNAQFSRNITDILKRSNDSKIGSILRLSKFSAQQSGNNKISLKNSELDEGKCVTTLRIIDSYPNMTSNKNVITINNNFYNKGPFTVQNVETLFESNEEVPTSKNYAIANLSDNFAAETDFNLKTPNLPNVEMTLVQRF